MFGKKNKPDVEALETAPASPATPDAALSLVEENPAPSTSSAPEGKQPPRPRRVAPAPEN